MHRARTADGMKFFLFRNLLEEHYLLYLRCHVGQSKDVRPRTLLSWH